MVDAALTFFRGDADAEYRTHNVPAGGLEALITLPRTVPRPE
jgi:hypothetical protein